jgi:metal-sulfur cluster biosynthetic enzyme
VPFVVLKKEEILRLLNQIPDPEIPVINIVELGVIRDVLIDNNNSVTIVITPTYSGCPAMKQMEDDIKLKFNEYMFDYTSKIKLDEIEKAMREQQKEKEMQEKEARANRDLEM